MKLSTMFLIATLSATGAVAGAQTTGQTDATNRMDDRTGGDRGDQVSPEEFAKKAGAAGAAEVEMGKLGAQKATDPEVKAYAQKMVTDHTKANRELMAAAKGKGLEVPTAPDMLHKGMMEKFERQDADHDFNHDFMQQMVRDHEMVVELYQNASNDSTLYPELRALAKKTLPTLQQHLADAQKLEAKLGSKKQQ